MYISCARLKCRGVLVALAVHSELHLDWFFLVCRAAQLARTLESIGLDASRTVGGVPWFAVGMAREGSISEEQWSALCESAFESGRADLLAAGLLERRDGKPIYTCYWLHALWRLNCIAAQTLLRLTTKAS